MTGKAADTAFGHYEENCVKPRLKASLKEAEAVFQSKKDSFREMFQKDMEAACRTQGPGEKTAYVSWELLRSRLLVQKDEYRIMRYGKEWFLSGGYEAGTTDVSLIMEIYHRLERRLQEDAKRYVGKIAALRAEEHTAYLLRPFHEYVKELIQYAVTDATGLEAFRKLRKEERFQLRVGECLEPGYLVYMENRGKTREELLKKLNSNRRESHCYEDFQQMELSGLQLAAGDFRNADFRDAALEETNLCLSIVTGARFRRSHLRGAKLSGSMMHGADFTKADLRHAHMEGILLCDGTDGRAEGRVAGYPAGRFSGADLRGADFRESVCCGADFTGADLHGTDFTGAGLYRCRFTREQLEQTHFTEEQKTQILSAG